MSASSYTRNFEEVAAAERERVAAQRRARGVGDGPSVGLALSGGGIRSACWKGTRPAGSGRYLVASSWYLEGRSSY